MSNKLNVIESLRRADLVIGAALIPGAMAPKTVTRDMLLEMQPGSVIIDVCIDQGGTFETSRPTSHDDPIFKVGEVIHYCVANMPGALSRTSTFALTNATFPLARELARKGAKKAVQDNPMLAKGLNLYDGKITHPAVAEALGKEYISPESAISL